MGAFPLQAVHKTPPSLDHAAGVLNRGRGGSKPLTPRFSRESRNGR